jgi:ABC-type polysaccharide/polyol phosphate transport system ATPase subunit
MARVSVENASVSFYVGKSALPSLPGISSFAGGKIDRQAGNVLALNNFSVEIGEGERVGLIGHNGAGKSTLLRTMAGIYVPVKGRVRVEGTVSALFQSSPGLEPDDSGYQNILNCGLYLGMSKKEILAKRDEIADFTELGEYLHLPARIYSAGMLMRLSFAIVTSIDPDILLVDEALGTGDAHFAHKAQQRVFQLAERSSILVMASHSPSLLASICNRAIYLDRGKVMADGPVNDVVDMYHQHVAESAKAGDHDSQMKLLRMAGDSVRHGQSIPADVEEASLRIAMRIDPGNPNKLQRLCILLQKQGKPIPVELEIETLEAVLSVRPNEQSAVRRLAELKAAMGGMSRAE